MPKPISAWEVMFGEAQRLVRTTRTRDRLLKRVVAFARGNPEVFDEPAYWDRVERHNFARVARTLGRWAKDAWKALDPKDGWQILMLSLGDCPETFEMGKPQDQDKLSESKVRKLLSRKSAVVEYCEFESCFTAPVDCPFAYLETVGRCHNVVELKDRVLSWNVNSHDYHGNNGYFLWLALSSFALLAPMRDAAYRKKALGGRDRIHLMAGFEEIGLYIATITPQAVKFTP